MQNFVRNLLTEWRRLSLPFGDETFVVAVSGGADSAGLLLALHELKKAKKLDLRIVVAHFNHNLRGAESDEDETFVKNLAVQFDFELALGNIELSSQTGNLEQNARAARYSFLIETARNVGAYGIITAHTLNDQAETFLMNLMRGSGIEGLGGIKPIRNLESETEKTKIKLIRPLLNWAKREDTENFCHLNNLEFRYDSMNEDLKFSRVRIRKVLLPMLKDFNPKIIETLAKTATLLREDAACLENSRITESKNQTGTHEISVKCAANSNEEPGLEKSNDELNVKDLKDIFPSIRRSILREWLKTNRGNLRRLELNHIEAIEKLIVSRKSGRLIDLPNGEKIIKKNGKLIFQKTKVENKG